MSVIFQVPYGPSVRVVCKPKEGSKWSHLYVQVRDVHAVSGWRSTKVVADNIPDAFEQVSAAALNARRKLLEGETP